MTCDCGCGKSPLSKGEQTVLKHLRDGVLWDLPDALWAQVVSEVEKAGSITKVQGSAQVILYDAITKQAGGFGGDRSAAGRYAAEQRWKGHVKAVPQAGEARRAKEMPLPQGESEKLGTPVRWDPKSRRQIVKVSTVEEAYEEIAKGNIVEMATAQEAVTIVEKMADYLKEVEEKTGEKPKNLNFCQISVPGTNLFCGSSVATDKYPDGVPRVEMPQLSGIPKEGSKADKLARIDDEGNVDVGKAFVDKLAKEGVETKEAEVPASWLKASQSELKGKTVSFFLTEKGKKILDDDKAVIYVSRDGYVIDGHHRWAGKVFQDLKDGKTGDVKMRVRVIDMPIMEVLDAALDHSDDMGIKSKKG
jgi:hypothetical protein